MWFKDHLQTKCGKALVHTIVDHRALVNEGLGIMASMNDAIGGHEGPFMLVGDCEAKHFKSFWYKIHCKICVELFTLCPPCKNLKSNLESHVQGLKHAKALKDATRGALAFKLTHTYFLVDSDILKERSQALEPRAHEIYKLGVVI